MSFLFELLCSIKVSFFVMTGLPEHLPFKISSFIEVAIKFGKSNK
jgi:hypothetical protein